MKTELSFADGSKIQCGTIFCIASNYSLHAKEMGTSVPSEPSVFIKPAQALVQDGEFILIPEMSGKVHHEVELVVCIGKDCSDIAAAEVQEYIAGYAVGIDVTMRDVQSKAKADGKPWAIAKGFRTSAPVSQFIPSSVFGSAIPEFDLALSVNGETRQKGNTGNMERSVSVLVEFLSKVFTLRRGDLIFTGTPEGVGKINKADNVMAELKGYTSLSVVAK